MILEIGKFVASAIVIVFAGIKLTYLGDIIAEKTGWSRAFVGVLLLSAATSLPELITSINAVLLGNPDMAIGDIAGSNLLNIFIIVILQIAFIKKVALEQVSYTNVLTAAFGIATSIFVILPMLFKMIFPLFGINYETPFIFHIGIDSIIVFAMYIYGLKLFSGHQEEEEELPDSYKDFTLKKALFYFVLLAGVIFAGGIILTKSADFISKIRVGNSPLGGTFVGSLFLALVTSFPEIVVSTSAVKMGSYDMALGNILGSNMFNLAIIFVADIFYKFPIISSVNSKHLVTFSGVIFESALVIIAISMKKKSVSVFSTILIAITFLAINFLLFVLR